MSPVIAFTANGIDFKAASLVLHSGLYQWWFFNEEDNIVESEGRFTSLEDAKADALRYAAETRA